MNPLSTSIQYAVNGGFFNSIFLSQVVSCYFTGNEFSPYFFSLSIRKKSIGIFLALPTWKSFFLRSIAHVVGIISKKKVSRVNARWIVSIGTIMKNLSIGGYFSMRQYPRYAMRSFGSTVKAENPIAILVSKSNPQPALLIGTFFNFFPKSFIGIPALVFPIHFRNFAVKLWMATLACSRSRFTTFFSKDGRRVSYVHNINIRQAVANCQVC